MREVWTHTERTGNGGRYVLGINHYPVTDRYRWFAECESANDTKVWAVSGGADTLEDAQEEALSALSDRRQGKV